MRPFYAAPPVPFAVRVSFARLPAERQSRLSSSYYPITVTDMAGRQVTITQPPERIAVQDGRTILDLAVLDKANPFARVVVWNNLLKRMDTPLWNVLANKWPAAKAIPDMGFSDDGEVNLEEIIADKPQLLIAELRSRPTLEQEGVMRTLASLHIPVVFIDNTDPSGAGFRPLHDPAGQSAGPPERSQSLYRFLQRPSGQPGCDHPRHPATAPDGLRRGAGRPERCR